MLSSWPGRIAAILWSVAASLSANAAERCTAPNLELPVQMIGAQAVVKVGINGTQVPLLVDSGAFFSTLSPAAAAQLGLKLQPLPIDMRIQGIAGEMEAQMTVVDHMLLQGGDLGRIEFVVGGNELGAGTMGILGRNILTKADVEYDFAHGMIRFFFPKGDCSETNFAYWAADKPVVIVPLLRGDRQVAHPAIRALAEVNKTRIKVLFDTGANASMLKLAAARSAGINAQQMQPAGWSIGIGKGKAQTWVASLDRFALEGEEVQDIRMEVADIQIGEEDMLLGMDFFLAHRIYVSRGQRRMYLTHNGGPVFAHSTRDSAAAQQADPGEQPQDAAGYARRGAGFASRQDYAAALADLNRACEMAPDQADYFVRRAVVQLALRHGRDALRDFDTAIKLNPTQPEALLRRASLRPLSAREAALADLNTLDQSLASQAPERLQMAALYERFDEPRAALAQLTNWIAKRDDDIELPAALHLRCRLRMNLQTELDAALDDCDRAVRAEPRNAGFVETRGLLRLHRSEWSRAQTDFDKALELKPERPWSLYGRGLARSKAGLAEAGRADLEAARKLRPQIDAEASKFGLPQP
jgi:predicted aspartyl protease/tetratricopeptide (TPR) repeat protein